MRKSPERISPPGTPSRFTVTLNGDGALRLKWKCANPRGATGTMYQIWRRTSATGAGEFDFLGVVGTKRFTDATVPAGASEIIYRIQAVRSSATGPQATFNVLFGTQTPTTPATAPTPAMETISTKKAA